MSHGQSSLEEKPSSPLVRILYNSLFIWSFDYGSNGCRADVSLPQNCQAIHLRITCNCQHSLARLCRWRWAGQLAASTRALFLRCLYALKTASGSGVPSPVTKVGSDPMNTKGFPRAEQSGRVSKSKQARSTLCTPVEGLARRDWQKVCRLSA